MKKYKMAVCALVAIPFFAIVLQLELSAKPGDPTIKSRGCCGGDPNSSLCRRLNSKIATRCIDKRLLILDIMVSKGFFIREAQFPMAKKANKIIREIALFSRYELPEKLQARLEKISRTIKSDITVSAGEDKTSLIRYQDSLMKEHDSRLKENLDALKKTNKNYSIILNECRGKRKAKV